MGGGKIKNIFKWHIHVFKYIDAHKEKTLCFKCEETKNKGFKRLSGRKFLLLFLYNSDLVLRMYGYESRKQKSNKANLFVVQKRIKYYIWLVTACMNDKTASYNNHIVNTIMSNEILYENYSIKCRVA